MTIELPILQTKFQDRLLSGTEGIHQHLADGGPFMKVYEYAYVARQQEILAEQFPAVHTLLGDERFAQATAAYVLAHPPSVRSARWIGDHFAGWIAKNAAWSDQPMLADMAAFEWALGLAFDAPDDEILNMDALATVPPDVWPALTFQMHPAMHVVTLGYDVTTFQQAVAGDSKPDELPTALETPRSWAVWRNPETLIVRYRDLATSEAIALTAVRAGATFAALCEFLAEDDPENAHVMAAGFLREWLDAGWISGLGAEGMSWAPTAGD
ncbi:MAG: DNA-binding domain-containing protein [Rhodospirillales bacterium]